MKKLIYGGIALPLMAASFTSCSPSPEESRKPNIIFILSDDLNWGDLGCYGQEKIKTPNIDRIAGEGIRFMNAYAGSAVCAPARSTLMQGLHSGHARVRDNMFQRYRESLQPGDYTVAMLLKEAGYTNGLFGKWGLALHDQPGIPNNMGFDEFFGYLNQQQAHCFYPEFLYHNQERIYYPENGEFHKIENYRSDIPYDSEGRCLPPGIANPREAKYSFDECAKRSLEFVKKNKDNPFFLYLAYTIPHGQCIVPELGEYLDTGWPVRAKEYAAMVTRMDREVGKLMDLLKQLHIDENTILFFASDNGVTNIPMAEYFSSFSPTRGGKGNIYNGAFNVPAMIRWPGTIAPGQVSDHIWAFWDFMPTVAELIGRTPPGETDGISLLPLLTGKGEQKNHEYLYWEFQQDQAVRYGNWYGLRPSGGSIELYNLEADPGQTLNLAEQNPEVVAKIARLMEESHTPSDVYPSPGESKEAFALRLSLSNVPPRPENVSLY